MTKKVSKSKRKFLDISRQLMMRQGYNATKIEEICSQAELTKGAFFYYFKTKEDLGLSVLDDYWQRRQSQFMAGDWMDAEEALEQIEGFLSAVAKVFMSDPEGISCLAGSFTGELAEVNPNFREMIDGLFTEWGTQIKPILEVAKEESASGQAVDIDQLADYIIVVTEGALILATARQDKQIIETHLGLLNQHIQVLLKK